MMNGIQFLKDDEIAAPVLKVLHAEEKRVHTRVPMEVEVTLHPIQEAQLGKQSNLPAKGITATSRDLSNGGMSLKLAYPHKLPPVVKVSFNVRHLASVTAYAGIVWEKTGGFGLQFVVLGQESRNRIQDFVKSEQKRMEQNSINQLFASPERI